MGSTSTIESRLAEMGITLPQPPRPLGAYIPVVRTGNLLFLSGMLPLRDGVPAWRGTIGSELDLAAAQDAARMAVLNGLSLARAHLGSLEAIRQVVRLTVYQRTSADFVDHPKVADAASELLQGILGPAAGHTRMVFGVYSLPAGVPIEVELILEVSETH